jgi:tetratricopeptide (TPR) repeat protein
MEIQQYKKANKSFEEVVEDKDNLYLDQARWYLSMCHIRLGNIEEARNTLQALADESEYYRDKARKVERQLIRIQED